MRRTWNSDTAILMSGALILALAAVASLAFPRAFVAAMVAAGALVAFRKPAIILGALAMSVPVQTAFVININGSSFTLTKLTVLCLAIGWLPRAMRGRVPLDRVTWGYAAIVVALLGSVAAVDDHVQWAAIVYQWAVAVFVYVLARAEIRTTRDAGFVVAAMALAVIGISIHGVVQVLTDDGPPSFFVNGVLRAYGTFGEPNPLAAYLELSVPLLLAIVVLELPTLQGLAVPTGLWALLLVAVLAGVVTLVLTQSRGGWLGFSAGVIVIAGMLPRRWRFAVFALGICALVVVLQSPIGTGVWRRVTEASLSIGERVHVTPTNWANEERRAHWGAALRMFLENPLSGVGAGEFNREYGQYTPEWRFREGQGHAHNGYLQLAAESGIAGLLAFVLWCGLVFSALAERIVTRRCRFQFTLATGCCATFVAFIVHSMVDYLNVLSLGIQIALVIAVGLAHFSAERIESDGRA